MERLLGDTDAGTPEGKLQVLRSVAFLVVGIAIFIELLTYSRLICLKFSSSRSSARKALTVRMP